MSTFSTGYHVLTWAIQLKRQGAPTMEIAQVSYFRVTTGFSNANCEKLWVYPIKALRGCQVPTATLTKEGFTHDRKFVLLKDLEKTPRQVQHMAVTKFPNVCLFHTSIQGNILTVTYRPPGATEADVQELKIPLEPPNFEKSERIEVNMHSSPTIAFDMGAKYNQWFSEIFGFKVILAYWGGNPRQVLGNLPGKPTNVSSKPRTPISRILSQVPIVSRLLRPDDGVIAFNDCAPYLVITEESTADVTSRLPDGITMDMTKFRANIILRKSPVAFDEDFWGQLIFGDNTRIILTGNCGRCVSLNIDYATGTSGAGRDGQVLKLLSSDRRVDPGMKYSPIFGRYGFVSRRSEGKVLRVGEEVVVGKRNAERTRFCKSSLILLGATSDSMV
jgi:uncharacterized protein YcbX